MEKPRHLLKNTQIEIVHAVRGRVRLRVRSPRSRQLLPTIAQHLRQQAEIETVTIKETTGSLVATFEPERLSVEQLLESLQSFGLSVSVPVTTAVATNPSWSETYSPLISFVPVLVGLALARRLGLTGWKSILAYLIVAGVTEEIIEQISSKPSPCSEEARSDTSITSTPAAPMPVESASDEDRYEDSPREPTPPTSPEFLVNALGERVTAPIPPQRCER